MALRDEFDETLRTLDIDGKPVAIRDPRGNTVMQYGYDLAGATAHTISMDAGERWMLADVQGKPLYTWDARALQFHMIYDLLRRPTARETLALGPSLVVLESTMYGSDKNQNQNGRMITQRDGSGVVDIARYDFKGNAEVASRRFATDAVGVIDWSNPPAIGLEPDTWTTTTGYDALSRVVMTTTPDGSVTTPAYSEANLPAGLLDNRVASRSYQGSSVSTRTELQSTSTPRRGVRSRGERCCAASPRSPLLRIEDGLNGGEELRVCKWFRQGTGGSEKVRGRQVSVRAVSPTARHGNDLDARMTSAQFDDKFDAFHFGHDQISQHEVRALRVIETQRLLTIARTNDRVSRLDEGLLKHVGEWLIVVHQ